MCFNKGSGVKGQENGVTVPCKNGMPQEHKEIWGTRHTFALLSFLGFASIYIMRVNLSVTIVAMAKAVDNMTLGTECPMHNETLFHRDKSIGPQYNWDSTHQGIILGSFFYGYVASQIPGGILSEKYGGKWVLGLGCLLSALLTLVTPLAAEAGIEALIAIRALEGLGIGVAYPAMHTLMAKWVPLPERSRTVAGIAAGANLGTVVAFPLSSVLTHYVGWPSVYYLCGGVSLVWFALWTLYVYDSPEDHPSISLSEKKYIEKHTGDVRRSTSALPHGKLPPPPIKEMFTSTPFWALMGTHIAQMWGYYTLLALIPTYLQNIQHFSLKNNGIISGLPYLCALIISFPFSWIADKLIMTQTMSVGRTKKLMQSIGQVIPAFGLVGLSYVGCDMFMATVWLCICVGVNSAVYSGYQANHMDLAPNYAGTMMGITNTIGNFAGFVAPYITGLIINGQQTQAAWRSAFLISSVVYLIFSTTFVLFGSAEVQPWNSYWEQKKKSKHLQSSKDVVNNI